jgi:hypothetical protein
MPIQAGTARDHRSRPSQVAAQAWATRAGYYVTMETRGQVSLMGPRVPAQTGAPWSSGHIAGDTWNLVGPCWVPAQTGAPRSGRCTALVARNHVTMETRAW